MNRKTKAFKLNDLFDIENTWTYGKNKQYKTRLERPSHKSIPIISGITINNGINYYTEDLLDPTEIYNDCLTITTRGEYSGTVFYHDGAFALANNILVMPMKNVSKEGKLYIATLISKLPYGGYNGYPTKDKLKDMTISLTVKTTLAPDFEIVRKFGGGVSTMNNIDTSSWKEFKLCELFDKIQVEKINGKAGDFPAEPINDYIIPLLTCSTSNQGFSRYAKREQCPTILKNVISVSANGTGIAFYQSNEFAVLQDSYALKLKYEDLTESTGLYLTTLINKLLVEGKYDWTNKSGWNNIKDLSIKLPVKEVEEIDWDYMEKYIRAMEKVVIADVVKYKDQVIETTKRIVEK